MVGFGICFMPRLSSGFSHSAGNKKLRHVSQIHFGGHAWRTISQSIIHLKKDDLGKESRDGHVVFLHRYKTVQWFRVWGNSNIQEAKHEKNNPQTWTVPISTSCGVFLSCCARALPGTSLLKARGDRQEPAPSNFIVFISVVRVFHHQPSPGSAPEIACSSFIATINIAVKMSKDFGFGGKGITAGGSWRQAAASAMGPRT
jgi:hypothetical protein